MGKRSLNENTKETSGFSDVAGINEDWIMESYGYGSLKTDGTGTPALYFNFKNGPINLRLTEFDITLESAAKFNSSYPNADKPKTDEEVYEKQVKEQDARLIQIARVFVDKSEATIEGDDFTQLATNFVNLLTTKGKNLNEKLRLKVIYNSKGYLEISTKNGRFIQLASDPIGDMRLTDWEKERVKKDSPDGDKDVENKEKKKTAW